MQELPEIMTRLRDLSPKSKEDKEHFEKLEKLLSLQNYAACARHIIHYQKKMHQKTEYQKQISNLLPHVQVKSPADAQNRLFQLLCVLRNPGIPEHEIKKVLDTGGALVVNEIFQGNPSYPVAPGDTPLPIALEEGDENAIKLLLKYGANLDSVININQPLNNAGETALQIGCRLNIPEIVIMALDKNANPNTRNMDGEPCLSTAVFHSSADIQLLLLNKGADPTLYMPSTDENANAFLKVYHDKNISVMQLMIEKGYVVQHSILKHAEKHNPDIYKIFMAPYKERKKQIISSGSFSFFHSHENDLSPLYRVLYSALKDLDPQLKKRIDKIYYYPDSLLKPLLDVAILGAEGGHDEGKKGKKLKILMPAEWHIAALQPTYQTTHGLYNDANTVYAAGFSGDKRKSLATLLHELKHFADKQVYGTTDKPYLDQHKNDFDQVKEQLREHSEKFLKDKGKSADPVDLMIYQSINSIFTVYRPEHQNPEVLVKVAEVIGYLGMEKGLAWLNKNEPALLKYYQFHFNPACIAYLEKMSPDKNQSQTPTHTNK